MSHTAGRPVLEMEKPSLPQQLGEEQAAAQQGRVEEELPASPCGGKSMEEAWLRKGRKGTGGGVALEGYVDGWERRVDGGKREGTEVGRTKSLTDDDLEDLKGCLDLGFGFSYEEIPGLCSTLPALELCYSMNQRFLLDEQQHQPNGATWEGIEHDAGASVPLANWKISSPGDHPEEVKARLKYWAQAVACTVRLCG